MKKFNSGDYDGFETSVYILAAIEELTAADLLDADSSAFQLWKDGYTDTINDKDVMDRAWSLTPPDEDELVWGCTTSRRAK